MVLRRDTRLARRRHTRQLQDHRGPGFSEQLRRSALGLVSIYNLLPQDVVEAETVAQFQCLLQSMLKDSASRDLRGWQDLFSPSMSLFAHPLLLV